VTVLASVLDHIERRFDDHLELAKSFVRQPSISADGTGMAEMAALIRDKIIALGGKPIVTPAKVKYTEDAKEMLRNSLEDEEATVQRYVERREQAEACGEYGLAVDFDDLIRDETRHRDELRMMLKRWA